MKRDMDLCRRILLDIENDCFGREIHHEVELHYHLALLKDVGFIDEESDSAYLTNAGHDFIELARDEARWRKAKSLVIERTGGLNWEVLKTVLTKMGRE